MRRVGNKKGARINPKATIPSKMSSDLAEEIGMHIGDGCLRFGKYKKCTAYSYEFTSGTDEEDYCLNYAMPLFYKLYSLKPSVVRAKHNNSIRLCYKSKRLFEFKKSLGLPVGKKDYVEIPECVLNSKYVFDCIRGLFDTDGCLHFQKKHKTVNYYPRLDITNKSEKLILQLDEILGGNGFTTSMILNTERYATNGTKCINSRIFLYGKNNLKKWLDLIGFSNPKNINKLQIWQKSGQK